MHLDKERLEQLRTVLVGEYDAVSFFRAESTSKKGYWYVTAGEGVGQWGAEKDGDYPDLGTKSDETFLKFTNDNDVKAEIAVYASDGRYHGKDVTFVDWQHLADYLGVSSLVAISTKVPRTVAEKFRYYTTRGSSNVSETLRGLVYDYVEEEIKGKAKRDMFRD